MVSGEDAHQHGQPAKARVRRQSEHRRHRQVRDVERPAGTERPGRQLSEHRHAAARGDVMNADQRRDADQHHREQRAERKLGPLGRPHARLLERGDAVGDRLDAGDRRAAGGERLQDQDDPNRLRRVQRHRGADLGDGMRMKRPDDQGREHAHDEHRERQREHLGGLRDPEHVDRGEQRERDQADREQVARQPREHAGEARRTGREADRHGQHVVDDERSGGKQGGQPPEISLCNRVRAAAVRVRCDHL